MDTVPNPRANSLSGTRGNFGTEGCEGSHEIVGCRSTGLPDDPLAEMESAFGYGGTADELTEREIDELYVQEMNRRDRAAQRDVSIPQDQSPAPPGTAAIKTIQSGHFARLSDGELIGLITAAYEDYPALVELGYIDTPEQKLAYLEEGWREVLRRLGFGNQAA